MTRLYAEFFYFPFLVFHQSLDLHLLAIGTSVAAALLGAARAIYAIVRLPPAVAMQPPAPLRYRTLFGSWRLLAGLMSQRLIMIVRNMVRRPLRTLLTALGASLSVALLVTALFSFDSIAFMIDTVFQRSERQDATLVFAGNRTAEVVQSVRDLPGVMRVEPFRAVNVILRHGHRDRRLSIASISSGDDLSQMLDTDLNRVDPPKSGLMVSERVASLLDLRVGDIVEIELIDTGHLRRQAPVTAIVQSYVGLTVNMQYEALARLTGEGELVTGTRVALDRAKTDAFYQAVKVTPAIAGVALQTLSRQKFRETIGENIAIVTTVYTLLALIITFGVIYNSARIQLSEQGRELASLRVLGFTRGEVSTVLMGELAIIVLFAQPLGWLLGTAFSWSVTRGFESDLFRVPFVINVATYGWSSLLVILAAIVSAWIVRRRIDRLDLVAVLKTRE